VPFSSLISRHFAVAVLSTLFIPAHPSAAQTQTQPPPKSDSSTASHILHSAEKAAGGSKALSLIKTIVLEGSILSKDSTPTGAFTFNLKLPNRYYMELVAGDKSFIDSFNGKSAWRQNAAGEMNTLVGTEALQLEAAGLYCNSHYVNLKKNKLAVTYVGTAKVHDRDADEIEVTSFSGAKRQLFFDAQTHLLVEEDATMGGPDDKLVQKLFYSDYRAVNGVQLPYKIWLQRANDGFDIQITRAALNEPVGERVFDFPRKSQVILPDMKKLFAEVDARQKVNDQLQKKYAGTKIENETPLDRKGNPTKPEVTESFFFYYNGGEVDRVLKKNGQPLTPDERKAEDDRFLKAIADLKKHPVKDSDANAKADDKKDSETSSNDSKDKDATNNSANSIGSAESDQDVKDSDFSVDTFLRVAQFVNPRRERYQGQDVLAFDFEPNPEYKAHGLVEHLVQKLGGVIWIDERTKDVVRLDAFFASDMKFAGGLLADLEKDTRVIIMNTYVGNEAWLPEYEEVRIAIKLLLVKTYRIDESTKYFDYKKFDPSMLEIPATK
jgi:hypothetical protein